MISIGESADGTTVRLRVGDTVEVALAEPVGGGYRWTWQVPDGVGEVHGGPDPSQAPGAAGLAIVRLHVEEPGRFAVRAALARPWEDRPIREFVVDLHGR